MTDNSCQLPPLAIDISRYKVHVVGDYATCQDFTLQLKLHCEDYPVLGFDCEWWCTSSMGNNRKVALLQLASAGGLCILVQMTRLHSIPQELSDLLHNDRILKVGIGPLADGIKLHQDYGLALRGTMDLQTLAQRLDVPVPYGMKALAKSVLGFEMDKKKNVILSNWERPLLTKRQIDYASKDAIVGLEIFRAFNQRIQLCEMEPFRDVRYQVPKVPKLKKPPPPPKRPQKRQKPHAKRMRLDVRQAQQLQGHLYTEF